jgi:F0F1-type ATP synthase beta subunit
VGETLHANGLSDDFATRIGRLIAARGDVIEALFDPQSLPDLLSELAVSDEKNQRAVAVQVIQRPGGGVVRGVIASPIDNVARGATVLNSLRRTETALDGDTFKRVVRSLTGPRPHKGNAPRPLETGIKVIDVLCPLIARGTVAIAGELGAGTTVVMEELVRRLSGGADRVSLFTLVPRWEAENTPEFSHAEQLRKEGFSEGTVGVVQTFFLRAADGPWSVECRDELSPVETVIHRHMAEKKIYPCVDPGISRSRLLATKTGGDEHTVIAERVRQTLGLIMDPVLNSTADPLVRKRARKLSNYFAQPFFCAEPWSKRRGSYVTMVESLRTCTEILDGVYDDLPAEAFYFAGGIGEIRSRAEQ